MRATGSQDGRNADVYASMESMDAERELIEALETAEDEGAFRQPLQPAREAQADRELIRNAEGMLRRFEAADELQQALGNTDAGALQRAVASCRDAGVDESFLEGTEERLRILVAVDELAQAVCGDDEVALRRAVAKAKEAGVHSCTVKEAEIILRRLVAGRELRATAKASTTAPEGRGPLRTAVVKARRAGLDDDLIPRAEATLRRLDALDEVRMHMASAALGLVALQLALVRAHEAGVPADSKSANSFDTRICHK